MKSYEELQKEWNESTYGNEFAHYVYSIDKETIERLEKEKEELFEALKRLIEKAAPQTHSMDIEKACTVLNKMKKYDK